MPIYEYECSECNQVIEIQQRISDSPLEVCPDCGGSVKKIVSVSSFQLKGGGWYADGYSKTSDKPKKTDTKKESAPSCDKSKKTCKKCPAKTT